MDKDEERQQAQTDESVDASRRDEDGRTQQNDDGSEFVRPKKEFKFIKSVDEMYDEANSDVKTSEEENPGQFYGSSGQSAETDASGDHEANAAVHIDDQDDESDEEDDPSTGKKRTLVSVIVTAVIVGITILVAAFLISAFLDYTALNRADKKIDVVIPKNSSVASITTKLKEQGVIDNPIAFRLYAKLKHISGLQYGTYTLNTDMSYDEIVSELKKSAAKRETVKITIPEGKTVQWIDQKLADSKVCEKNEFIEACQKGGIKFTFNSQIPTSSDRLYKYEGYMFPDTYYFYTDWTGKAAAQKMLDNFTLKFDDKLKARATEMGMTVDQTITLASIIQAETGNVKQMSHVSSVFHNRLKNGVAASGGKKLLQSDATIYYITKESNVFLQKASTTVDSPYNTYTHEGLTPGPICNPGMDAIHAALYPDDTNDYYFVTDSNSNYYYASTYSEHTANVRKAMRTNSAGGTDVYK
jgi:UPF0755 protein